jgi:hypothetical protein
MVFAACLDAPMARSWRLGATAGEGAFAGKGGFRAKGTPLKNRTPREHADQARAAAAIHGPAHKLGSYNRRVSVGT